MDYASYLIRVIVAITIAFYLGGHFFRPHTSVKAAFTAVLAVLFALAFAVPFTAMGLMAMAQARHRHDPAQFLLALPFLTIGIIFFAVLLLGGPAIIRQRRMRTAHADEPWMWDHDWASGVIPAHAVAGAIGSWVIAVVWNGIAIPMTFIALSQTHNGQNHAVWLVLLFPLAGIALLVAAIRTTLQAIYFGQSSLNLCTIPAAIGGALAGVIHLERKIQPSASITLHLACREITRGGKSSYEHVVWENEQTLDSLPSVGTGSDIPVYFPIPLHQPPTSSEGGGQIFWRLDVTAPTSAMTYRSKFRVPVFVVTADALVPPEDSAAAYRHHASATAVHRVRGVTISRLTDGGRVMHVAAARNPGSATVVSLIGIGVTAATVLLPQTSAPIILAVVLGITALVVDMVAINAWFSSSTITARPRSLTVVRGLPMMRHHREMPAADIDDVVREQSSQLNETFYYNLNAVTGEKEVRLASGICGEQDADELILVLKEGLGMNEEVATV